MTDVLKKSKILNCNGRLISLDTPQVMGIVNVTPDSFYSPSRCNTENEIVEMTKRHLAEGATFIDLGAYSTRPGCSPVSESEEIRRLDFALGVITENFPEAVISVDTFRSLAAHFAVKNYGVSIINDISGGLADEKIFDVAAETGACYVLTHNTSEDIVRFFVSQCERLRNAGVKDIILDPGFGFTKTLDDNYTFMRDLENLKVFEMPVLVGISRKSMIYKFLGITPEESVNGTTVLNTIALNKGADILRVHDVKQAVEAVKICGKSGFIG